MKKKSILLFISILILLSGCNAYKSVEIGEIKDFKFKGLTDNIVTLDLNIPIKNMNGFNLKVKSMDIDISVNGKYVGKMTNPSKIIIPKNFDSIQTFPVQIEVKNILASSMTFYKLKNAKNINIQIEGKIKVKALLHSKTIDVSEKKNINL